jgi:hypothetical protein
MGISFKDEARLDEEFRKKKHEETDKDLAKFNETDAKIRHSKLGDLSWVEDWGKELLRNKYPSGIARSVKDKQGGVKWSVEIPDEMVRHLRLDGLRGDDPKDPINIYLRIYGEGSCVISRKRGA